MRNFFIILIGKLVAYLSKKFNLGGGSTWPGHIALIFNKNFIEEILNNNQHLKVILVTGTNGKTTTVSLLKFLLEKKGYKVFTNHEGANLLNGMASTLIKNLSFDGKISHDFFIFECDEFAFPIFLQQLQPEAIKAIIILNLFRDQLDRYGEVNTIANRWFEGLKNLLTTTYLFINGDDPNLYFLGRQLINKGFKNIYFFGVSEKVMKIKNLPHDIDFNFCPVCLKPLIYKKISYSHLGDFYCQFCHFQRKEINDFANQKIKYPLTGLFMIYNTHAVLLFLEKLLNFKIDEIKKFLSQFKPKFGRQERFIYQKKEVAIFLAKNPVSYNQTLLAIKKFLREKKANFLLILNDRIPDGRDVSWIWDVDFDKLYPLVKKVLISGDRAYDLALRLKYDNFENFTVVLNLKAALSQLIAETKRDEKLVIIPNYSAMLEVRKLLVGKKFE